MECPKDLVDRASARVVDLPPRQFFGHRIHVLDIAVCVGRDHPVADRLQRDLRTFLFAEKGILINLTLGDVRFHADDSDQSTAIVNNCLCTARHPAPFAILVLHAVSRLEVRRLPLQVPAHDRLDTSHVIRVHEVVPVDFDAFLIERIAQHAPPARRQLQLLLHTIEVPYAVIRGSRDELVLLFVIPEATPVGESLQARCE